MRILGIDYGDKKIGLAFGDTDAGVAVPLDVVPNRGQATLEAFAAHAKKEDIDLIVVGVPLPTDARHGAGQLRKAQAFVRRLAEAVPVPVVEEDESHTTVESLRLQHEEGAGAAEDALAAMLIVDQYMRRTR
ncbi:Holliday junction resolvase RuvX [Candidatus Uhrbacteria bacterium]|nr:Holliday junction resolvase RuvX [Candidatus Uhrbacteria bacterium]